MYERMLNKSEMPSYDEMVEYTQEVKELFSELNAYIQNEYQTETKIVFPYGNTYGWGVAHRIKTKLICNVFPESHAFSVMIRLTNQQFDAIYPNVSKYTQEYIDSKYSCSDGGWIHYRVINQESMKDIQKLIQCKLMKK